MTDKPAPADLMLVAPWVLPIEPAHTLLREHAVVVDGGRIVAILPVTDAERRYAPQRRVALATHVLLPGLINLHTHAAMALMRGLADDLPLMTWLNDHIWPAESHHVSAEFVREGTLLACAEMLRAGVTCFNDMYFFPDAAATAARQAGMRAALGIVVVEFPTAWAAGPEEYLDKGLAVRDRLRSDTTVTFCLAPHAPYTVSDASFARVREAAEATSLPVHVHVHETTGEIRDSLAEHGARPLARLARLGLVNERLLAVHAVHLLDEEIALLADRGAHVAHCPAANLKLASGIAPVVALEDRGVNVGIGTDGAASNNRLDLFAEMRLAALVAKVASGRADALPAHRALEMVTINAARALGLAHRVGSLVPGKAADLVAVDLSALETSPCYDPVSHLVYAAGREHVTHVWVEGRPVLEDRHLTHVDEAAVARLARQWQVRLAS
jgi:5-methylthioadenosine/S-adenosylhomocysteine deaminase